MRKSALLLAILLLSGCRSPEERLAEHLERAQGYFDEEKWNEAKIEYLNVVQIAPDNADGHYKLAEVLWKLENYGEARWQYKETVRLDPGNVPARLQLARIELALQRGKEAQEHVDAVLELQSENVDALLLHGILASQRGDVDALIVDTDRALAIDATNEAALTLKARALETKRDFEGAEAVYLKLIESHGTTQNMIRMALFLATRQRNDESVAYLRKSVDVAEDDKQRARARLILANAYLNRQDPKAAEAELDQARKESPDDSDLLLAMARFFVLQGQPERAIEMLEQRVETAENKIDPLMVLADFQRSQGNHEATLAAVDRALQLDPEAEVPLLKRAEILMESAERDPETGKEARRILAQVLERNPNSVRGMFTQAKFLLLEERPEEAAAKLRRVVDEEPNANAYVLLGSAYLAMKEPDLARAELLRAVQLEPGNVAARTQLAALYAERGEKDLALQEARAALARKPDDLRLIILLAGTLHGLDKDEDARKILDQIDVEKHRERIPSLPVQLAALYRRVDDLDRARALIEEEAKRRPDDPGMVAQLALQDLAESNPQGAVVRLDEGIAKFPKSGTLYELRARVRLGYVKEGQPVFAKEAEQDLLAAIENGVGGSGDAYLLLASLYQQTNRSEEAIETYEKALTQRKDDPEVHLMLGMLYEKVGRTQDAVRAYESVIRIDPKHGIAMNNLAWLLSQGDVKDPRVLDRALQLAQAAEEILPTSPSVADTLGWVMLQKNIPSAAISLFREAIEGYEEGNPLRALIRYHLAQAYQRNGEPDRAKSELETALAEAASFPDRSKAEDMLRELEAG
jgi:tetratricopeptide (TPR) repeat protein